MEQKQALKKVALSVREALSSSSPTASAQEISNTTSAEGSAPPVPTTSSTTPTSTSPPDPSTTAEVKARAASEKAIEAAENAGVEPPDLEPLAVEAMPRKGLARKADGTPTKKTQRNITDPDSHLMQSAGSYLPGYNCQVAVDNDHQVIVAVGVSNQPPDVEHLGPMLQRIDAYIATGRLPHGPQAEKQEGTSDLRPMQGHRGAARVSQSEVRCDRWTGALRATNSQSNVARARFDPFPGGDHPGTRWIGHRGPAAPASLRSALSRGQPSASARAT